jgi:acetoacetate decarboxylase
MSAMSYPQPPWTIQGQGLLNLHLLEIQRVRPYIPNEFKIISIFPGKTVGGIYIATYQAGSTLIYNELIVVSGLVAYANHIGVWISHIYVDHPDSVAGGRAIWGLPKELAQFDWHQTQKPRVKVRQGDRELCQLDCQWQTPSLPLPPLTAPVLSLVAGSPHQFQAVSSLNLQLVKANLSVPPSSPFAALQWGQSWLSFYSDRLSVTVAAPTPLRAH